MARNDATSSALSVLDDDALLRCVEEVEERAVGVWCDDGAGGRPSAQRIAVRRLDLDDLRATVGEQLRAVRARDPGREIDHAEPAQGECRTSAVLGCALLAAAVTVSRYRGAGDRSGSAASRRGTCCRCPSPRGSDRRPSSPCSASPACRRRRPGACRPSIRATR